MYRPNKPGRFEKIHPEHGIKGPLTRVQAGRPIDQSSAATFQGLAIAAASGGTILLAGVTLLTL